MLREALALVITPKSGLLNVVFGLLKFTRLNALKNSARNCRLRRSRITKFFSTDMSRLCSGGPVMMLRPALPNVNCGEAANAPVLNQRAGVGLLIPGTPTRLGRCPPARPSDALSNPSVALIGWPLYRPTMPDHSQLPRTLLRVPLF